MQEENKERVFCNVRMGEAGAAFPFWTSAAPYAKLRWIEKLVSPLRHGVCRMESAEIRRIGNAS